MLIKIFFKSFFQIIMVNLKFLKRNQGYIQGIKYTKKTNIFSTFIIYIISLNAVPPYVFLFSYQDESIITLSEKIIPNDFFHSSFLLATFIFFKLILKFLFSAKTDYTQPWRLKVVTFSYILSKTFLMKSFLVF